MCSSTRTPFARAAATVMAVRELLWQDTHPAFSMKATSARCNCGRLLSSAPRTEPTALASAAEGAGPSSLHSRSAQGVDQRRVPCLFAKSRMVPPGRFWHRCSRLSRSASRSCQLESFRGKSHGLQDVGAGFCAPFEEHRRDTNVARPDGRSERAVQIAGLGEREQHSKQATQPASSALARGSGVLPAP